MLCALINANGFPYKSNKSSTTNFFQNSYQNPEPIVNKLPYGWTPDTVRAGNVRVCSGCHNKFDCNDLVLKHAELRSFTNPHTGSPVSKFGNAYYHTKQLCVRLKWRPLQPNDISHRGQCVLYAVSKSQRQSMFRVWSLLLMESQKLCSFYYC